MLDLSILIPFKDKSELTIACLETLHKYGDPVKEIILVSNGSSDAELSAVLSVAKKFNNTKLIEYNHPFNYQKINNFAAKTAAGKVLMLLNNDIELNASSKGLLSYMYKKALEPTIGAVGCVLLYEDAITIQHAGVYLVAGGTADHLYIGKSFKKISTDKTLRHNITKDLDVTAVTAAAVMVERKKFEEIKGMNEDFIICGGDVDLCLRLSEKGYDSLLVGSDHGRMIHKESKSRSMIAIPYVDFYESYKSYVKQPDLIALRSLRKSSHLAGRVAHKTGHFMNRVEGKVNRTIVNRAGSESGSSSISIDDFFHAKFPFLTPIHPALPEVGQKPSVTVFVPTLSPRGFYGGIATLLIVSAALAKKLDYDYRVVQTSGFEKNATVLEFLADNGIDIPTDRFHTLDVSYRTPSRFAYLPMHPDDVAVVSAWWDAYTVSRLPLKKKFVYMIQDYEPIFYNNSDDMMFAESTYHTNNFIPLCNTELLYDFFNNDKYPYIAKNATWFEPAVGKVRKTKKKTSTIKKIFLYGRPNVHRNLFYSAIRAIDLAMQDERMKDVKWAIFSAGQNDLPNIKLKSGHTIKNLGKMDLADYYKFAESVDVAVSPMLAPHPNYPTLELASLGAGVVTTKYETKHNLSRYASNIILADPTIDSMADAIIKARFIKPSTSKIGTGWNKNLADPLATLAKIL
jgi:GT2 family glycosyltransferase